MTLPFEPEALRDALIEIEPAAAGRRADIRVVRAPGRVNLIGEHTDYNEGFVLPAAIDLEIRIAYLPTADRRVELVRLDGGERDGFDLDSTRPKAGTWLDYVAGTAWALGEAGLPCTGLRGVIASTLPPNAGLSSSAAIELAAAWALLDGDALGTDRFALARLCQRAENAYVGVQSGLMDQFAESCGIAGSAVLLDCRSHEWRADPAATRPRPRRLPHRIATPSRRLGATTCVVSQCEAAVAALGGDRSRRSAACVTSLPRCWRTAGDRIDPVARRRAEHVVSENDRVLATVEALASGDLAAVGRLFAESHASLRDRFEVSSPELDAMVGIATAVPGVIAARMTGAGFGGCTVNLVRHDAVEALRTAVDERYQAMTGLSPRVFAVDAVDGAGRIG